MLINRSEVEGRRLFTMGHELAHLLRLHGQVLCDLNFEVDEERFANQFAASLLIPEDDLREYARPLLATEELGGWATTDAILDRIAARYRTSREATAWRLEGLRMLPAGFTKARLQEWLTRPRPFFRGPKGKRWRRRLGDLGKRHATRAREAYQKGAVSLSALADILRVDVTQADQWLASEEDD
jgi:Zn-dependent peptidase ImmA (M78 family)